MLEKAIYVYMCTKKISSTKILPAFAFIQNIAFHWLLFVLCSAPSTLPQNVLIHLLQLLSDSFVLSLHIIILLI